jgi:hypothetical protein
MKHLSLIAIALLLFIAACKTTAPAANAAPPAEDTVTDNSFKKVMRDKELYAAVSELVPLDTVYLSYDTLHILTKRLLACDADNFKLMWNGAMLKSLPPQTSVKLFQQVEPDCKERHVFHLTFNVKPLQLKADSASFSKDSCAAKTTILRVGGYKHTVGYTY